MSIERMTLASDEEHARALAAQAAAVAVASATQGRAWRVCQGRDRQGRAPEASSANNPLATVPPPWTQPASPAAPTTGPVEYDARDLEQRGREILRDVLKNSTEPEIVDFRKRRHIGAYGMIDWKTFVGHCQTNVACGAGGW